MPKDFLPGHALTDAELFVIKDAINYYEHRLNQMKTVQTSATKQVIRDIRLKLGLKFSEKGIRNES